MFERDGVRLHYEEHGVGAPILLLAPGGMRSQIGAWGRGPWDPVAALSSSYRVVAMDQRNAAQSSAPIRASDGWATYAADQLALLDHLGIAQFMIVGMCIGGPYAMGLIRDAPTRVRGVVMIQPVGLDDNRKEFFELFDGWAQEISAQHPEADDATWASFRHNMFGGDDLMFGASRAEVAACKTPLLVLRGDDVYHPSSTSETIAKLAQNATLVQHWKAPEQLEATDARIQGFLAEHARA